MENMPTAIKLFYLLENTRWTHLPIEGGWYDQHPQFVDEMMIMSL
jgi:hypothetical protein